MGSSHGGEASGALAGQGPERRQRILVCDPIAQEAIGVLERRSEEGVEFEYKPDLTPEELLRIVPSFDAIIVRSRTKVTREVIERATSLRVIGRAGVGLDNVDANAAKEKHVVVLNTPDALTNAVAEFTLALMLDLARSIPRADASMKRGEWAKSSLHGTELKGKTYGTVGIGRIGRKVSELAYALGMTIIANDIIPIPREMVEKLGIRVLTQQEIFSQADFVDLHVPLTEETERMVNYQKLKSMKKTAYLINTSRGKVICEQDLVRALEEGLIAGAALDVFEVEPPARTELLRSGRVILTPHIAGQTEEAQAKAGTQAVEAVLNSLMETKVVSS
jgi:D-3-phosphoglycerate dehydrogenase